MDQQIQNIVDNLVKNYQPEKVILFGSMASGKPQRWSDVDLVAIKKTDKRFYDRIGEVTALIPHDLPIDILVYTPEEFTQMANSYFIKNEVLGKGRILYERS